MKSFSKCPILSFIEQFIELRKFYENGTKLSMNYKY